MSGGYYNYLYHYIEELVEKIEEDFFQTTDYDDVNQEEELIMIEDHFEYATPEQKDFLSKEVISLIRDLKFCANRAKELEWFMSGDIGVESYIERLKKIYKNFKK